MLQELSIRDFAIISTLTVRFDDGMTVLTGETGAGKSIVIDAVSLLIGKRGSVDYIRNGAKKCQLEGLFTLPAGHVVYQKLEEYGIEAEDEMIIIQRDIFQNGKNTCRINGRLVNTTILKKIGSYLVDIQGQHDNQRLLQPEEHLSLLDDFGKAKIDPIKQEYQEAFQQYQEVHQLLEQRRHNEQEFVQRLDMLQYQKEEIEAADLEAGEEEELIEERNRLNNFLKIGEQLQTSYEALTAEGAGSLNALSVAMSAMNEIADLSSDYQEMAEEITSSYYVLQDIADRVVHERDLLEMDPARQEFVEERLRLIRTLKRKYGESIDEILAYYDEIVTELDQSAHMETQIEELEAQEKQLFDGVCVLGKQLTKVRQEEAQRLTEGIHHHLKELYMDKAIFEVRFKSLTTPSLQGLETVEFYISTNVGEEIKPLVKVVSGGELSRIMLALKTIFSEAQGMTSIVFDEVDTGVSGRVAKAIADKIYQIGEQSQVLCISHLPQVAAIANHQYHIQKEVHSGRTEMKLTTLSEDERIDEIARMLSGSEITEATRQHAKELLN